MGELYPDNPALYAQRIRASYRKFLKYHSEYPKFDKRNNAIVKITVAEAKRVVNLSDKEIIRTYHRNERNNTMLRMVRLINQSTELMIEADKISQKEKLSK